MSDAQVYSFESIVEEAAKAVLASFDVLAFTSTDAPVFQKDIPRVEVTYEHGQGQSQWTIVNAPEDVTSKTAWLYRRESAWKSQLVLNLLTAADIAAHNSYRSKIRSVMGNFWQRINETYLPYHQLGFSRDAGTSDRYVPQDGFFATKMLLDVDLSIQANAWALLDQ